MYTETRNILVSKPKQPTVTYDALAQKNSFATLELFTSRLRAPMKFGSSSQSATTRMMIQTTTTTTAIATTLRRVCPPLPTATTTTSRSCRTTAMPMLRIPFYNHRYHQLLLQLILFICLQFHYHLHLQYKFHSFLISFRIHRRTLHV